MSVKRKKIIIQESYKKGTNMKPEHVKLLKEYLSKGILQFVEIHSQTKWDDGTESANISIHYKRQ